MNKIINSFILLLFSNTIFPVDNHFNGIFFQSFGNGKVIIAVNGGPGMDSWYFKNYLMPLSKFYKLVIFDQRGCGNSQSENISIQSTLNDIESLRKYYDANKIVLFAHSYGCIPAIKYLLKYRNNVEKVLLISGYARKHPEQYKYFKLSPQILKRINEVTKSNLQENDKNKIVETLRCSAYFYNQQYHKESFLTFFYNSIRFNEETARIIFSSDDYSLFDERENLRQLSGLPVMVGIGKHDIITPLFLSQELSECLMNSKLMIFEKSGHFPFIEEQAEFIAKVRAFIK